MEPRDYTSSDLASDHMESSIRRLTLDWSLPPPPQTVQKPLPVSEIRSDQQLVEYQWAGETIRHIGSIVHRCIQWIAKQGIEQWNEKRIKENNERFILMLKQAGVPEQELNKAGEQVQAALRK